MPTFQEMGLSRLVIEATTNMGFEEATLIQEQAIPVALTGRDIIGQAQTGTGKTAAFGIPLVEKMDIELGKTQGIVITPTRELAVQVAEELNRIGQFKKVRALPIYGGQDITRQIRSLKNRPQIIVGTPGRLMDHMRRKTIKLDNIKIVVLDEADEMLNMGFLEDIETILKEIPQERQTLLFSATMPKPIQNLAARFLRNSEFISVKPKEITVPNVEQDYYELHEKQKFDVLCRLLDIQSPERAIIFGRTKRRVDELHEALNKRGYSAEGLHGDLTQARRDTVLRRFREGVTDILVATDVAARGLDITGVTHVYNFDVPQDPESYVHRIGRTGRVGKSGLAVTFITSREQNHLRLIETMTNRKIVRKPIPSVTEAIEGQQRLAAEKLMKAVEDGNLYQYKELAESLLEDNDSITLVAAMLKMLTKEADAVPITLTEQVPFRQKKSSSKRPFDGQKRQGSHYSKTKKDQKYPTKRR